MWHIVSFEAKGEIPVGKIQVVVHLWYICDGRQVDRLDLNQ